MYALCHLDELPNRRARGFVLARRRDDGAVQPWPIFVIRWGRTVVGYENRCPHDAVHLDWERGHFLDAEGVRILCGKHGALFDMATGTCVEGPCVGAALTPVALQIDAEGDICLTGVALVEDDGEDSGCDLE
jgi:nitrite reductase/ring-hydroxylating ferredoxin subunit